jgi:hypothetical protein
MIEVIIKVIVKVILEVMYMVFESIYNYYISIIDQKYMIDFCIIKSNINNYHHSLAKRIRNISKNNQTDLISLYLVKNT